MSHGPINKIIGRIVDEVQRLNGSTKKRDFWNLDKPSI